MFGDEVDRKLDFKGEEAGLKALISKEEDRKTAGEAKPFDASDDPSIRVITFRSVLVGLLLSIVAVCLISFWCLFRQRPHLISILFDS